MMEYGFVKKAKVYMKTCRDFPLPVAICYMDGQIYWSNSLLKTWYHQFSGPDGLRNALSEFDMETILERIRTHGTCTLWDVQPFSGFCISLSPMMDGEDMVGIIALFVARDALPDVRQFRYVGSTAAALTRNIRNNLADVFGALDAAFLKATLMESAEWLSPHFSRISRNAYQILRVATNISEYSKFQSGMVEMSFSTVDICARMRNIQEAVADLGNMLGIPVTFSIPDRDFLICLDIGKFDLALFNILHNAFTFSQAGNEVSVNIRCAKGLLTAEVEDKGTGIPQNMLDQVWRPYQVLSEVRETAGIGLGLTLVKLVAEAHDGKVDIRSEPGKGTCVALSIPDRPFSRTLPLAQGMDEYIVEDRFSALNVGLLGTFYE